MQPIFIHSINDTFEHKFVKPAKLVAYTIGDKLGKKHYWETMLAPKATVHIMVINKDLNTLHLVKQTRVPVAVNTVLTDGVTIEACAGLVDKYEGDEDQLEKIALDEIKEELGYTLTKEGITLIDVLLSNVGMSASVSNLFLAVIDNNTPKTAVDPQDGENLEEVVLTISEAIDFIQEVENTDATTKYLIAGVLVNYMTRMSNEK